MCKKILIIVITIFIVFTGFLTGFFSVGVISVYADNNNNNLYTPLRSESDLVKAFQAYCKSRDLTIDGSVSDAVTKFTTGSFNGICNTLGINITELQAELKAEYDQSGEPVKFFFNSSGVMAMNRIFAQFLQDNNLSVGDKADEENNTVYNGYSFTDDDGNYCLCTVAESAFTYSASENRSVEEQNLIFLGTPLKYSSEQLVQNKINNTSTFINANNQTFDIPIYYVNNCYSFTSGSTFARGLIRGGTTSNGTKVSGYGFITAYVIVNDINPIPNKIYIGTYSSAESTKNDIKTYSGSLRSLTGTNAINVTPLYINVFLTTNNNIINYNNYEGDTYITNEGDVINNNPQPEPKDPNDVITNLPENPSSPNDDGGWNINLPDIDIPNLPIGNLSEKFPFSIPWDLVAFYAMLDAEPEAPRFNGTMDLTLVQWNYDIDLSPFDSAADLCRKLQFGLFVVGLIVASRSIIRG